MGNRQPTSVIAAIIKNNDRYLITQRPIKKEFGGRWEFPGGKIKFLESPEDCLEREIGEELGTDLIIDIGDDLGLSSYVYGPNTHILLTGYSCKYIRGEVQKKVIMDHFWARPHEMGNYNLLEADLYFVEKLRGY